MKDLFKGVGDFKDRITFDIDSKDILDIERVIYNVGKTNHLIGFKIKRSNSKGWHIIAYYSKKKSEYTKNKLRRMFDDKYRLWYDKKEKPQQILFSQKRRLKK